MGILTGDVKRFVEEQKLAFCATVCPDGSNLSPRGSTRVWDDEATTEAEMLESQRARFARLHERQAGR